MWKIKLPNLDALLKPITHTRFQSAFGASKTSAWSQRFKKAGVTLSAAELSRLQKADLDGDGKIGNAKERAKLFSAIDGFDRDGNGNTVSLMQGRGYDIAHALMSSPAARGNDVADNAKNMITRENVLWGVPGKAKIENPNVVRGGHRNTWKCSVFAGESLYRGGFEPPTAGRGRLKYYESSIRWHHHTKGVNAKFEAVHDARDLKRGDIITFQYHQGGNRWGSRGMQGHVMTVSDVKNGRVTISEVTPSGAHETNLGKKLKDRFGITLTAEEMRGGIALDTILKKMRRGRDRRYPTTYYEKKGQGGLRLRMLRPTKVRLK